MKKKDKIISNLNPLFFKGIAHRGLHDDVIPENSMEAFLKAKSLNIPIELDVHLTKDNNLIVHHDANLIRVTGKEGLIEQLTVKEIKENYKLPNGEEIPTFDELLDSINEEIPIVLELKVVDKNQKALCDRVKESLKKIKDKKNVYVISFRPEALNEMKNTGFQRSLLVTYQKKYRLVHLLKGSYEGVDADKRFFDNRYARKWMKKNLVNVWTIESEEQLDKVLPYVDLVTYQYIKPEVVIDKLQTSKKYSNL